MENNYLEHYGILGMKWGIRRYRNKDGTLTNAGKKRAAKLEAERRFLDDAKSKNSSVSKSSSTQETSKKSKDVSEMTDEELNKTINRIRNENTYKELTESKPNQALRTAKERLELERDYKRLYNELHPQQEKFSKKLIDKLKSESMNAVNEVVAKQGKNLVEKMMNKVLGIKDDNDSYSDLLKKDVRKLEDDELNKIINRMRNEQAYKEIVDKMNGKDLDSVYRNEAQNMKDEDLKKYNVRQSSINQYIKYKKGETSNKK